MYAVIFQLLQEALIFVEMLQPCSPQAIQYSQAKEAKSFTASGPWEHGNTGNLSELFTENHLLQACVFSVSIPSYIILCVVILEGKMLLSLLQGCDIINRFFTASFGAEEAFCQI